MFATPAVDLIYSLYFDLSAKNRQINRSDFIRYYYEEFCKALKSYGYWKAPPTLLDLNIEIIKTGALEAVILICFLPFMFIDWTAVTPEDFLPQNLDNFKRKSYQNPEYQKLLKSELKRLFHQGSI